MPFELESMTKVRVLDVRTLAAKDRKPGDQPGAQLLLSALLPHGVLAMFDGFLPGVLYEKATGQLEGMEGVQLTSVGKHVKRLPWDYEQTGCTVVLDLGINERSALTLEDCKVHRVSFVPQPTGVKAQWTIDRLDLPDDVRGKLSGLKRTDVDMTIALPEVAQEPIDGTEKPKRSAGKGGKAQGASAPVH